MAPRRTRKRQSRPLGRQPRAFGRIVSSDDAEFHDDVMIPDRGRAVNGSDTGTKASGPDIRRNPRRDCTDYRVFTTVRARKLKTVTIMPDPVLALV